MEVEYEDVKWHYIDKQGKTVFFGKKFDNASSLNEGLAKVQDADETYFINTKGERVE